MVNILKDLAVKYLYWQEKEKKAAGMLDDLKKKIIIEAKKKKIKKIKSGQAQLFIITQSESRFPHLNDSKRKQVEKIVRKSGELAKATVFDIVKLGNAYDKCELSRKLRKVLKPYAKRVKSTKIVVKRIKKH